MYTYFLKRSDKELLHFPCKWPDLWVVQMMYKWQAVSVRDMYSHVRVGVLNMVLA